MERLVEFINSDLLGSFSKELSTSPSHAWVDIRFYALLFRDELCNGSASMVFS